MSELIFVVEDSPEGGYTARALGQSIFTEADDWQELQANVRDDAYKFTNGERVKVAHVNEEGGIILEDKRTIPRNFRQFTHGYAITAHRSQGKTVDEVIISGDRFTSIRMLVVS